MKKKSVVVEELNKIAEKHRGVLHPEDVIKEAKPKNSPLHNKFDWDNTSAAHQYRLWQARELIRVSVIYLHNGDEERITKAFVSLSTDRGRVGGGYRPIVNVLSNEEYRAQLLQDSIDEMNLFRQKYRELKELAGVFWEMSKIIKHKK